MIIVVLSSGPRSWVRERQLTPSIFKDILTPCAIGELIESAVSLATLPRWPQCAAGFEEDLNSRPLNGFSLDEGFYSLMS